MDIISLADFSHKKELTELWIEAFSDNAQFITSFLDSYMIPEYNVPVIIEDGKIVSVFYLIEFELYSNMKLMGSCAYLFAAATKKEYRGRGYMSKLIKYAAELYKNRGVKAIFLFPQDNKDNKENKENKLFDFYAKLGFSGIYQAKKITNAIINTENIPKTETDLTDLTAYNLQNQDITDTDIFDDLYKSYIDFTAKQMLSPLKDRMFYFRCAESYLESPENKFAIFERKIHKNGKNENNVEKLCYVFYKIVKNTYYIDDIIFIQPSKTSEYSNYFDYMNYYYLLFDYIMNEIKLENVVINALPLSFSDNNNIKLGMIMPLAKDVKEIADNLKSPVYLNMYMNI